MNEALGQLLSGAFFFGIRSSEFLTVTGRRKTKRIKVRNIRFFRRNVEIRDKINRLILYADTVSITFEFKKNKQWNILLQRSYDGVKNYVL